MKLPLMDVPKLPTISVIGINKMKEQLFFEGKYITTIL